MREVRCEFHRGGRLESVHRVVVSAIGGTRSLLSCGPVGDPVWMRSCAKPFQTLTVVESGAADRYRFGALELAIMSGSHGGDPDALRAAKTILRKARLRSSALRCGAHPPVSSAGLRSVHRSGRGASPLHNNCSGKHAGMLAACRHLGARLESYLDPRHPFQRANLKTVSRFTGVPVGRIRLGVDGCSAPTFFVPLRSIARAMAGFSAMPGAPRRIAQAMVRYPNFIGRPCAVVMPAARGKLVTKVGAEGVYAVGVPAEGIGIATKVLDGGHRATVHVVAAVVRKLGLLPRAETGRLDALADPVLRNHAGRHVGTVRVRGL